MVSGVWVVAQDGVLLDSDCGKTLMERWNSSYSHSPEIWRQRDPCLFWHCRHGKGTGLPSYHTRSSECLQNLLTLHNWAQCWSQHDSRRERWQWTGPLLGWPANKQHIYTMHKLVQLPAHLVEGNGVLPQYWRWNHCHLMSQKALAVLIAIGEKT